ncbi:MAG: alanine racemase [Candidatus Bruticola sp.]
MIRSFNAVFSSHRYSFWIEVNLDAIRHNYRNLRQSAPNSEILAIVKSEAYGHGLETVALTLNEEGVWGFGIANIDEGRRLRRLGITKPIVLVAPILPTQIEEAIKLDLRPPIMDLEFAKAFSDTAVKLGKNAKMHLKVDTGMGRLSVQPKELLSFCAQVAKLPNTEIEGIYSHFAAADQLDQTYTQTQFAKFTDCIKKIEEIGIKIPYHHIAASAGTLLLPKTCLELVRPGIALYGLWPSKETSLIMAGKGKELYNLSSQQVNGDKTLDKFGTDQFKNNCAADLLKPALTYKAVVSQVKTAEAGNCIGYGCTFTCHRTTNIAILPIGYADGLSRSLSNCGEVLIRGYRAPIIGRICMNLCMVDVTDIPGVRPDDEAVIIGSQGCNSISAEEIAQKRGTICYEVLTNLPMHIPRFYLGRRPLTLENKIENSICNEQ